MITSSPSARSKTPRKLQRERWSNAQNGIPVEVSLSLRLYTFDAENASLLLVAFAKDVCKLS